MNGTKGNLKEEYFSNTYSYLLRMHDKDIPAGEVIDSIKRFVEKTGKSITTSQLRNIYAKVLRVKENDLNSLQLIRPKLAYVAARQNKQGAKDFVNFLDEIISKISTPAQISSFKTFFESLVAYHKFYHP